MIELYDTIPDTNVQPAEYKRLLGFPREVVLKDRVRELAEWAREWYAKNGRPWVYARQIAKLDVSNGSIDIDDVRFNSSTLHRTLRDAGAHGAILAAVSAGPEVEAEARRLWDQEKPDEYFFLEIYGSAVVEHLTTMIGARLCAWAEGQQLAVLPHYSPGYPEWDISEQGALLKLLKGSEKGASSCKVDALDSGMLNPKKSLLAVFGLTPHIDRVRKLSDLVPCENCSLANCQYRRAPYVRSPQFARNEKMSADGDEVEPTIETTVYTLDPDAKYSTSSRALKRWVAERLSITANADGTTDALFRYDGTTCSNMGRSFTFEYRIKLGPRAEGYPILHLHCTPAAGDDGHRFMCRFMTNAEHLMVAIDHEKPLLGKALNDVLSWSRPSMAPACYCEPASRKHKWGLALETLHYALAHQTQPATPVSERSGDPDQVHAGLQR
jgi:hypothetical protein